MAKGNKNLIGAWAFLIGVILAVLVGLFGDLGSTYWLWALVILGLIVGFFNVKSEEAGKFMTAAAVLVIISYMGQASLNLIPKVGEIFGAMLALFVPATVIVALKTVFTVAKN